MNTNRTWKHELYRRLAEIAKRKDPVERRHELRKALADLPNKEEDDG